MADNASTEEPPPSDMPRFTGAGDQDEARQVQISTQEPEIMQPTARSSISSTNDDEITCLKECFLAVVVTAAQVPACVAFAVLARCPPMIGLHAAWLVGLPCALFGGRPGMIVGSAGALASVTRNFMGEDGSGLELLFASVICAGLLTLTAGFCKIGQLVGYVPDSVTEGFCNGLALVIGLAQAEWFQDHDHKWLTGKHLYLTILHASMAVAIVRLFPKYKATKDLPAHLSALVVGLIFEWLIFRQLSFMSATTTVGESFSIEPGLPKPAFLDSRYDWSKVWNNTGSLFLQTLTLSVVMSLESLMTVEVVNDIADDDHIQKDLGWEVPCGQLEQADRQLVVLGGANILAGFLGTMGGTALIELSVMNLHAGGKTRISSTLVPLLILAVILFASPALKLIPNGVLAGLLIDAVFATAKFESIPGIVYRMLYNFPCKFWSDEFEETIEDKMYTLENATIVVLVTGVTFWSNLAYGVASGMLVKKIWSDLEYNGAETWGDGGTRADESTPLRLHPDLEGITPILARQRGGAGGYGARKASLAAVKRAGECISKDE